MNTGNKAVDAIGELNFSGNIIPHSWYQHITFENGKADLSAIVILSEIVYWYRPQEVLDESSGKLLGYRRKFRADKLQRSYQSLADKFGLTKGQASAAVHRLESLGLLTIEFRTVTIHSAESGDVMLYNVVFLEPIVERLKEITYRAKSPDISPSQSESDASDSSIGEVCDSNSTPTLFEQHTNTKTINETVEEKAKDIAPITQSVTQSEEVGRDTRAKPKRYSAKADPRSTHPVIEAVREVLQRRPSKEQYDGLIMALDGVELDIGKLKRCYDLWVLRGYNPNNMAWATQWYKQGGPPNGYKKPSKDGTREDFEAIIDKRG